VYLDTDAPVGASGTASDDEPAPLFDRVTVEIFPPGASSPCAECSRELVADAALMKQNRFSFGVLPVPRVLGIRARLRLFRSAGRASPRPHSTIELVGYLPAVAEEGVSEVTAVFRVDDVGSPRGSLDNPIVLQRGAPTASVVSTWKQARVVKCNAEPPEGAVCIPGGAFFMGGPRVNPDDFSSGQREHLVVLSPFFLEKKEVTVAAVRSSGLVQLDSKGRAVDPRDDSTEPFGSSCDYTTAPGPNEQRPVMCASWQLASQYCASRGGFLPSEAQFEYVASRRGSSLYPWGDGDPGCADAVAAREQSSDSGGCLSDPLSMAPILAEPAGNGALDQVLGVFDLGANLSEWMRDMYQDDDEPCWSATLLHDPLCETPGQKMARSVKGGNFSVVPVDYALVRTRIAADDAAFVYRDVGFRCAFPAGS
jgi:formylglycine-generating enzyme required for sulfatase activity